MKTLVIGSGGREHALALGLALDPAVTEVHAAPGNPGISTVATLHEVDPMDGAAVTSLASSLDVDLVVIGPEAPLVAGVADAVRAAGISVYGPSGAAAQLEGSKAFSKAVMATAGVPTARSRVCATAEETAAALDELGAPYVVKDDALAAGKGVVVTTSRADALAHAAGCNRVVVEEFLDGAEVSLFAVCDGHTARALQPAQDFKRIFDGGLGANTGGMGAYSPLTWAPAGLSDDVLASVVQPTLDEMDRRGTPFVGTLYVGLALTATGPRVIEFNCRFGDPETQAVLPLLDRAGDPLGDLLREVATGARLPEATSWVLPTGAAVTTVLAAAGYPDAPRTGDRIALPQTLPAGVTVFHAGTALDAAGRLVTAGGRVLAVTAVADTFAEAQRASRDAAGLVAFGGKHYRDDIGWREAARGGRDSTAAAPDARTA